MSVLAGDVGGTKTLLQLAEIKQAGDTVHVEVLSEERFDSGDFEDLAPMVENFLKDAAVAGLESPRSACFGVAGPVEGDTSHQRARLTNLPWRLDSLRLAQQLKLQKVRLINDFQAIAYGIDTLVRTDLETLQAGREEHEAPRLVLGAGTGLGAALACWQGWHHEAYPTEGGHVSFAPTDPLQDALLQSLRKIHGRVSNERLLSGSGIESIYEFLRASRGGTDLPDYASRSDPAEAISSAAIRNENPVASQAMQIFLTIYGQVAGDLALASLPRAGVYIAGGIAPRILLLFRDGTFLRAFKDKGRMGRLLQSMPVHLITNLKVGLQGAALVASRL